MSFVGSIVGTQGEQVEVAFDIDKTAAGGNRYGFAPATGNLMYCMPQKGTKTSLYIGNGDEAQGIATGCIRTNGSTCEGTGSPEKKSFRSEHGKGMDLYPQSMGMDGGEAGKLTMEDGSGTLLESSGSLLLLAKEGIRLESMTGIAVHGVSDIMALYGAGTSSLCVNGSVDMMGALTGLGGSTYRNYAPYADAPEEGEFDWGGFTRNLVMGLAVGAACIAMSLLLPGIGTIAAGALMGAGIGAISASVAGAVGDYSSGNVRSAEEAIRDVAVSMVSGALTGAITGGLGAKLASAFPKAAEAVGKIPLADWAKAGLFNTGDGILGRMVYAVADGNMSVEEKFAYAFSPEHMAMDFLGGAAMYGMSKVLPKIREKLPWNKISNEGGADASFTWKLRGEDVTLNDVKVQEISYVKRSSTELKTLRNEFNTTTRKAFLEDLGKNAEYLRNAGFSETDILKIKNGRVPDGWQVHHKLPLDDSGTNSFDNLVLIQNEPYHKVITNYQNSIARQMKIGEVQAVQWPMPNGNIYPAQH